MMFDFSLHTAFKCSPLSRVIVRLGLFGIGSGLLSFCLAGYAKAETVATVDFLQIAPVSLNTYVLEGQVRIMERVSKLAADDFFADNKDCKVTFRSNALLRSDEDLFKAIKKVAATGSSAQSVVVGFTRTDFARVAARAAVGTNLVGLSSAAISPEPHRINSRFVSLGSPVADHWAVTRRLLQDNGCSKESTQGIFVFGDAWSGYFREAFEGAGYATGLDLARVFAPESATLPQPVTAAKCLFLGLPSTRAAQALARLRASGYTGTVVGTHDWTFSSPEVRAAMPKKSPLPFRVLAPVLWQAKENANSQRWRDRLFKPTEIVEPLHVSIYDSVRLALGHACGKLNLLKYDEKRWKLAGTVRSSGGLTPTGNTISPIRTMELPDASW